MHLDTHIDVNQLFSRGLPFLAKFNPAQEISLTPGLQ